MNAIRSKPGRNDLSTTMRQNMSSAGTGQGGIWSRSIQSSINGQTVSIEENQDQLSVTIERSDGTREKTVAKNLDELADTSAEAAELYRKLTQSRPTPGFGAAAMPDPWGTDNPASQILREQIESMKAQQGFQVQPMQNLLDNLLWQVP